MSSIFAKEGKRPLCTIDLVVMDRRMNKIQERAQYRIKPLKEGENPKNVAVKINESICQFFKVTEETDKKLFHSMFYQEELNDFEFVRNGAHQANLVFLNGNWDEFCTVPRGMEFPTPVPKQAKLFIQTESASAPKSTRELLYADVNKFSDFPTVALFNSVNFVQYFEGNQDLKWKRTITKIDLTPKAKL